jgi:Capsule assembly protein Wzi
MQGSVYVSLDSWIYPALERLQGLGYLDTAFLGLRPWTRLSILHMLEETQTRIAESSNSPGNQQAREIFASLAAEFQGDDRPINPGQPNLHAEVDRLYARAMYIGGRPLNDSYHFGQTLIDDYGRPYQAGFNTVDGFSVRAEDVRFSLDVRGEYQHAPGRAAYPLSVAQVISTADLTPLTIPTAVPTTNVFRLIDANLSYHLLNHEISVGKSEDWWGPGESGAMAWSNNAESTYALRINRVEPLYIPGLSKLLGPFRYEFIFGDLKGHAYPNEPWYHAQKINFKPTRNLELGFSRIVMFAGEGHVPLTFGSFWRSFTSFQNVTPAVKFSRNDPGARHASFDFNWRLPFLRNWVTLYSDSIVHDDVSPVDAPRHAAINPGIYVSHFPGAPKLDFRVEAESTDSPGGRDTHGQFFYWETVYRDLYTNKGFLLGSWIGREGKGGQAWLSYWLSPREKVQLGYRNAKTDKDFIPGGTTQNDFSVRAIVLLKKDLELNAFVQYERWKVPVLAPGLQTDTTGSIQITYYPKLHFGHQ